MYISQCDSGRNSSLIVNCCRAWWRTPLIPALGRQRQEDFWIWGQPGLQSEFQDSQGYTENPCFEKTNKQKNKPKKKKKRKKERKKKRKKNSELLKKLKFSSDKPHRTRALVLFFLKWTQVQFSAPHWAVVTQVIGRLNDTGFLGHLQVTWVYSPFLHIYTKLNNRHTNRKKDKPAYHYGATEEIKNPNNKVT